MHTEQQRQQAEDSRERAEDERQDAEQQRTVSENRRQVTEKHREVGEQLREVERKGERQATDYGFNYVLKRIEAIEAQWSQCASRLGSVEALLNAMQDQLSQLMTDKDKAGQEA